MGFLELPVELLRAIVQSVILAIKDAPGSIDEAEQVRHQTPRWTNEHNALQVRVEKTNPRPNSFGILATSKFLAEVAQNVIEDLRHQNLLVFSVDVLLVGERELWSTWLCVPIATSSIQRLEVSMRIADGHRLVTFEQPLDAKLVTCTRPSGLLADGGPPQLLWAFRYLFQSFFQRGVSLDMPQLIYGAEPIPQKTDRQIVVRSLHVNITTLDGAVLPPPEVEYGDWRAARPPRARALAKDCFAESTQNLRRYCLRPIWLGGFLSRGLRGMIGPSYGTYLLGRVGVIEICADEESIHKWDFGDELAAVRDGEDARWDEMSRETRQWWLGRLRERSTAGLTLGSAAQWVDEAVAS